MDWKETNYPAAGSDGDELFDDKDEGLFELMEKVKEDAGLADSEEADNEQLQQLPAETPRRNSRARHLSELTEQAAASGGLLISESGQAFAYQKGQGFYKPIPKLDIYLAGLLGRILSIVFSPKTFKKLDIAFYG